MISSRGALASILLVTLGMLGTLSMSGCDDPPTCKLQTEISGATTGTANWALTGEENCGFISNQGLTVDGAVISFVNGADQIVLVIDTPVPDVGIYPGSVIFGAGEFIWQAPVGSCSVAISKFEIEGWSQRDFITIAGALVCQQPFVATDPMVEDLVLTNLSFQGHLYDELIATPNF